METISIKLFIRFLHQRVEKYIFKDLCAVAKMRFDISSGGIKKKQERQKKYVKSQLNIFIRRLQHG